MLGLAPAASAIETLVLDGDDVTDWVRVLARGYWKYRDSALVPTSLVKFDLGDLAPVGQVLEARLHLFVERAQPGAGIELWHAQQDGWSYRQWDVDSLWAWPVWHSIAAASFSDSFSYSVDVTSHVQEELQAGSVDFSLKITSPSQIPVRLSSPLAPRQSMRPRLVVRFMATGTVLPDLVVSTADLRMSPMRPVPGQGVVLGATVRNNGPGASTGGSVEFWDGAPGSGSLIGVASLGPLSAAGETQVSMGWNAVRGLRPIHVVVDRAGTIPESDEGNNQDFRTFLVTDPASYVLEVESFEYPGVSGWQADSDVPRDFTYAVPKSFVLARSGAESYHGDYASELFLDGSADDGTLWLEKAVPCEPFSQVIVRLDFELFRYDADIAFLPVVTVGLTDPEAESDFKVLSVPAQAGWTIHSHEVSLSTGPYDMVHIAAGLTVVWETPGTLYMDLLRTEVISSPLGLDPPARSSGSTQLRNSPNPTTAVTTISFWLPQDGPVSLRVYDPAGRLVATLRDRAEKAGPHRVRWDGRDAGGRAVTSGVYVYRLEARGHAESRKLLVVH